MAHTVAMYFEIHREKRAVLHLIKPDRGRQSTVPEEENYLKIPTAKPSGRFQGGDKRSLSKKISDRRKKNNNKFFKVYGDELRELIIESED